MDKPVTYDTSQDAQTQPVRGSSGLSPVGSRRLRDTNLLLKVIDNLPIAVWIKDQNSQFVLSNKLHSQLIGVSEDDMIGHDVGRFLDSKERVAESRAADEKLMRDQRPTQREFLETYERNKTRAVVISKNLIHDDDNEPFILGANVDITDVRKNESKLQSIAGNVPVGILQIDRSNNVRFANRRAHEMLDVATDAVQDFMTVLGTDRPNFPGERMDFEILTGSAPNQRHLYVQSAGWEFSEYEGAEFAVVSIVDVSENNELRRSNARITELNVQLDESLQQLKRAQDQLIRQGKLEQLGQLTATVAHEIRNPLGSVRTSAFVLQRKLKNDRPDLQPLFERISGGVTRCDDIITQLLDFARVQELKLTSHNIDAWLTQILEQEKERLPATLEIHLQLGCEGRDVNFDPDRMSRSIINLVSNASEAMLGKSGEITEHANPTLVVTSRLTKRGCEIEVKDNGPGMTPEIQKKIFEPLFTTKNFGTGLGVPAVERIMEQHQGGLEVVSEVGKGSAFTLWWPGA